MYHQHVYSTCMLFTPQQCNLKYTKYYFVRTPRLASIQHGGYTQLPAPTKSTGLESPQSLQFEYNPAANVQGAQQKPKPTVDLFKELQFSRGYNLRVIMTTFSRTKWWQPACHRAEPIGTQQLQSRAPSLPITNSQSHRLPPATSEMPAPKRPFVKVNTVQS